MFSGRPQPGWGRKARAALGVGCSVFLLVGCSASVSRKTEVLQTTATIEETPGLRLETIYVIRGQIGSAELKEPTAVVPDLFGNLFIVDSGQRRILKLDPQFRLLAEFRVPGEGFSLFNGLGYAAATHAGEVFVGDTWARQVWHLDGLLRPLEPVEPRYATADSVFQGPGGVAADESGLLTVADPANSVIFRIDVFGQKRVGEPFGHPGNLSSPAGLALDRWGNLFISDAGNRRIAVYDPGGRFIRDFGGRVLDTPAGIAVDPARRVWVADRRRNSIVVFDPEGGVLTEQSDFGQLGGQLSKPTGLALDLRGKVYIADTDNNRLVICQIARETAPKP